MHFFFKHFRQGVRRISPYSYTLLHFLGVYLMFYIQGECQSSNYF